MNVIRSFGKFYLNPLGARLVRGTPKGERSIQCPRTADSALLPRTIWGRNWRCSYLQIKLMRHTMKLWEKVIEHRLRRVMNVTKNQLCSMPGRLTTKTIFLLCRLTETDIGSRRTYIWLYLDIWRLTGMHGNHQYMPRILGCMLFTPFLSLSSFGFHMFMLDFISSIP
jgi:hypothetical protein